MHACVGLLVEYWSIVGRCICGYDITISWTQETHQDLEWWVDWIPSCNSRQIMPKQAEVTTPGA